MSDGTDPAFHRVLARYEARAAREAEVLRMLKPGELSARRDEFLLHVGRPVALVLQSLAIARGAKRLVELGTSYGYSTLFLAQAARQTGGTLMTFEIDESKQRFARHEIEEAGLGGSVEWHLGDATALLRTIEGSVDFALIDLWKDLYVPCFEILYPKLSEHAVVAADNMLEPRYVRADAEAYRALVRSKSDIQSVLLPIGNGIELSCLWRSAPR